MGMYDFLDKIGLKAVLEAIKAKQDDKFARSYNGELRLYLNGQSGDIRALVYQLPIGEYALSTTDSEYSGMTFPIQGYCLISWFPSKSAVNDFMYGTLIIRPMSSVGATYICSVYNTYSYTDWEQISTTPIKSAVFGMTTNEQGWIDTGLPVATTKIISVLCSTQSMVGHVWQLDGYSTWCASFYYTSNVATPVTNTPVSFTIYYFEG